jgi:predicted metal-dependent hydrolase
VAEKISLYGLILQYNLKTNTRSRGIKITVYPDGSFLVTKPKFVSDLFAKKFVIENARWIVTQTERYKERKGGFILGGKKEDYQKKKKGALVLAKERLRYFNKIYNFKVGRISIRNQRTRWGSCSQNGNLSFSYKIVDLPTNLSDYIIVHELCHLGEMNHSKKFWDLVKIVFPNYKVLRGRLKGKIE